MQHLTVKFDRPLRGAALTSSSMPKPSRDAQPGNLPAGEAQAVADVAGAATADSTADPSGHSSGDSNGQPATGSAVADSGMSKFVSTLDEIAKAVQQREIETDALLHRTRSLAVQLASMIVRKVVGSSTELRTQRLEHVLTEAFSRSEPVVAVHVNEADHQPLLAAIELAQASRDTAADDADGHVPVAFDEKVLWQIDATVPVGECRVEYQTHELITRLDNQLVDIEHRLQEAFSDG